MIRTFAKKELKPSHRPLQSRRTSMASAPRQQTPERLDSIVWDMAQITEEVGVFSDPEVTSERYHLGKQPKWEMEPAVSS